MVNHNKMGLLGAISYIIGNIVGSGIFITPTSILDKTESVGLSLIIWCLSAVISILGAFCYVELGTSIRNSGADFAYLCYVKWYPLAFAFMCAGCILTYPATLAVQAQTFSEYVFKGCGKTCELENETEMFFAKKLVGFALIWVLMYMNFFSVKRLVQYFQIGASVAKVLATAIIVGTGFYFLIFRGQTKNLADPFPASTKVAAGALVQALFAGLFSYDGWDILNFGAEEIENPKRTMPLAIIIGLIIVAVIYVATNISYFVVLTIPQIKGEGAVATTFAQEALGDFSYAVPFLICLVLVGSLNSTMFSASRYLHAASRQGVIPSWISCVNKKEDSPRAALFLHVVLTIAISFAGNLDTLISYLAFAQWSQRACTMLALLWIRFKHKPVHPEAIRTPFFIPLIFFCVCMALVVVTIVQTVTVAEVGGGICVGGFIFYMIFIYHRSLPSFASYRRFLHKINHVTSVFAQITFNAMVDLHSEGEDQLVSEPPSPNESETDLKNKVAPLEEASPREFANSLSIIDDDLKKSS